MIEIRDRHVHNWENARTEQHVLTIKIKEGKLIKSLKYYKVSAYSEHRVHEEIEILTNVIISVSIFSLFMYIRTFYIWAVRIIRILIVINVAKFV